MHGAAMPPPPPPARSLAACCAALQVDETDGVRAIEGVLAGLDRAAATSDGRIPVYMHKGEHTLSKKFAKAVAGGGAASMQLPGSKRTRVVFKPAAIDGTHRLVIFEDYEQFERSLTQASSSPACMRCLCMTVQAL